MIYLSPFFFFFTLWTALLSLFSSNYSLSTQIPSPFPSSFHYKSPCCPLILPPPHQIGSFAKEKKLTTTCEIEATMANSYSNQNSSQRSVAMVLALVSAIVLSPLYVSRKHDNRSYHESKWNSGFVLPMVLAGLIIAIKTTSSSSSSSSSVKRDASSTSLLPSDPSWVLRIGSSSWGLAGLLLMLTLVLSWQDSVREFFWR